MEEEQIFKEEDIIWARLDKNPWWPAIIISIQPSEMKNENIYQIALIKNNTQTLLKLSDISNFKKNFEKYSKTKNKELLEAINLAKEIYDMEENQKIPRIKSLIEEIKINKKEKITENNNDNSFELSRTEGKKFTKKKLKKNEDKSENYLIIKICNYLRHFIAVLIQKDSLASIEKNKEYLCKILKFLSEYQIQEPIEFLKKTNLGKYIKYINTHVNDDEIKQNSNEVYTSFENQVVNYLIKQK
jgi:hypothetical protein